MLKISVSGLSTSKLEKLWNYKKRKSEVMISDFCLFVGLVLPPLTLQLVGFMLE